MLDLQKAIRKFHKFIFKL